MNGWYGEKLNKPGKRQTAPFLHDGVKGKSNC